jgi:tetratricopeptide (TPR) repeat protein
MLYELMTGRLPYEIGRFMPVAVSTICHASPRRPSSVSRTLRGDLETIVLKALEKEPAQRCQSVAELGEDIRRYLAGETILAKPPSALYILRKKVFRHRRAVSFAAAATTLALGSLWAGLCWQEHQRAAAMQEAREAVLDAQCETESKISADHVSRIREVMRQHPQMPEARLALAQALYRASRTEPGAKGMDMLKDAMQALANPEEIGVHPWQWVFNLLLAEIYEATDRHAVAKALGDEAMIAAERDDSAEAWYLRSFATFDLDEALACAQMAVARDSHHALAWWRIANLCSTHNNWPDALAAVDRVIALSARRLQGRLFKGGILTRMGRYHEAIAAYDDAGRVAPNDARPYRFRAVVYVCLKEYEQAERYYTKALELSPYRIWVPYQRAGVRWMLGDLAGAEADYKSFCQEYPVPSYADARLFLVLCQEGRHDQGQALLEHACRPAPQGWLGQVLGCLAGRITPQQLVDAADPNNLEQVCEAYYYAGEMHLMGGQTDAARRCFQGSVDTQLVLDPDTTALDPMSEYHLAVWRLEQLDTPDGTTSRPGAE